MGLKTKLQIIPEERLNPHFFHKNPIPTAITIHKT